jgi:hypothetical protein
VSAVGFVARHLTPQRVNRCCVGGRVCRPSYTLHRKGARLWSVARPTPYTAKGVPCLLTKQVTTLYNGLFLLYKWEQCTNITALRGTGCWRSVRHCVPQRDTQGGQCVPSVTVLRKGGARYLACALQKCSNPPAQSVTDFFAEQRNAKSTPAFSGCFRCQKRKNGLRDSRDGHLEARFASFYAILPVFCRKKQEKTPFALVDKRRFFYGGPEGIRTLDLSDANRTLSHLSYRPELILLFNVRRCLQSLNRPQSAARNKPRRPTGALPCPQTTGLL